MQFVGRATSRASVDVYRERAEEGTTSLRIGGKRIALSAIGVTQAQDRATSLVASEREQIASLAVDKKKKERIAGRVAAAAALNELVGEAPAVSVRESGPTAGQPFATHEGAEIGVSISHAGGLAVAAATHGRVGIDVDVDVERSSELLEMAFSVVERRAIQGLAASAALSERSAVNLAWCAKEAVLKWLGLGLRAPLQGVELCFGQISALQSDAAAFGALRAASLGVTLEPEVAAEAGTTRFLRLTLIFSVGSSRVIALVVS
jgi:phosphopantetheinyl transferase